VIGFNVVYQQLFRSKYDRGCQICCNWSRLKLVLKYHHTEVL